MLIWKLLFNLDRFRIRHRIRKRKCRLEVEERRERSDDASLLTPRGAKKCEAFHANAHIHASLFAVQSRVIIAVIKGDARVERGAWLVVTRSSGEHAKTRIEDDDWKALCKSLDGEDSNDAAVQALLPEPLADKYSLSLDAAMFGCTWLAEHVMQCAASTGCSAPPRVVFHDLTDKDAERIGIPQAVLSWKLRDGPSLLSLLALGGELEAPASVRIAQRKLLLLTENGTLGGDLRAIVRHRAGCGVDLAKVLSRFQEKDVVTRSFDPSLIIVPDGDCSKAWLQSLSLAGLADAPDGMDCGQESSTLVSSHWWYNNPPAKEGEEGEEITDPLPEHVAIGTALGVSVKLLRQPPDTISTFVFDSMGLGLSILMLLCGIPFLNGLLIDPDTLQQRLLTFWSTKVRPARLVLGASCL